MAGAKKRYCRGCGAEVYPQENKCVICNVKQDSSLKKPQVWAYIFFLFLTGMCGYLVWKFYIITLKPGI